MTRFQGKIDGLKHLQLLVSIERIWKFPWLLKQSAYSFRNASAGFIRAARRAGISPATVETSTANNPKVRKVEALSGDSQG